MMDDLINRQELLNRLNEAEKIINDTYADDVATRMILAIGRVKIIIKAMPSVNYPHFCAECENFGKTIKFASAERTGEWMPYNEGQEGWQRTDGTPIFMSCSLCHGTVINNGSAHWNYCPNCGARMVTNDD